ncbi:MAG: glutamine-hydrolyzing GMP synthase [Patescibacteria group bacterium]|nr:glutamine-hydrolyzing GMP synthase [Patescibacteria group bacterium]
MIFIVDFGSQTTHLISRRIKDLCLDAKVIYPEDVLSEIKKEMPDGIILSGGPLSVYQKGAPDIDGKIFFLNIPILGICYGFQLMAKMLGGKVVSGKKEYGPTELRIHNSEFRISSRLPNKFTVWMSHGDEIIKIPKGFEIIGSTETVPFAFVADREKKIFGVQFHPEVEHTEYGSQILTNFIKVCDKNLKSKILNLKSIADNKSNLIGNIKQTIKQTVNDSYVVGAVSGGVDSTVAGILASDAIKDHFIPIYVDNGLMRDSTKEHVEKIFKDHKVRPLIIDVKKEMLRRLKRIIDPEEKRKIIGNFYIEIFEKEMDKLIKSGKDVKFLLQGTIYSDVIESQGSRHASKIKSHHNVGGLPKNMKLKLIEPLRHYYKDEVRRIGKTLGLPDEFIYKQPFPGPGYAIRIRGEVTKDRLGKERQADNIVLEELESSGILKDVFLSFPVLTGAFSTAVKGDGRFFGEVIALRIVESKDVMTSKWAELPHSLLQKISSRIVNEVPGVSRVVYDITTKPPATMEWE